MKLTLRQFDLRTRHPFTISRGTTTVTPSLVVELEQASARGYGEAQESAFYCQGIAEMTAAIERVRPRIEAHRLDRPEDLWELLHPALLDAPFAECALDTAAHDLWGKLRGEPVWKLWGLDAARAPASDYTIGIDSLDVMAAKLREFPGFTVYKIKLGTPDDIEIIRSLRRETQAAFRVDANGAWTAEETVANSRAMAPLGVELIEQPLAPDDWAGMERAFVRSALPLVADESCRVEADVDRCAGCFHGINIKLSKCGGLTPARRMIARARQLGLRVMVGCFTESTVAISAAAQLLPLVDYADLDGALLLENDIATGVRIEQGRVVYPQTAGCGAEPTYSSRSA